MLRIKVKGGRQMERNENWSIALAETIMRKYPNPDDFPFRSWCYPQGYMLWGMEKLWSSTGDKKYFDYIMMYADQHVDDNGNINGFSGTSMDDVMAGSIIVWAYVQTGLDKYKWACGKIREVFDSYPRTSDGAFWHAVSTPNEFWVDGVFMGQMFLTKYGEYIEDTEYCFDEAAKQLILVEEHCRKEEKGLLYHAWCEDKSTAWADPISGCSLEVWSEGLGWYALILVEVLELFPIDHPKREQLIKQLKNLLSALKSTQDTVTGLWYQVVDKGHLPDNWHDTSGSAMFVYTVKKAIELGVACPDIYQPVVDKGYWGIITKSKVNSSGLVDIYDACDGLCVQNNYNDYINYEKTVNAKEAVCGFLWATWIIEKPNG